MILRGILLLARGRAQGISEFGNSTDSMLASLAPLIAFPIVGASITAIDGQPRLAAVAFLARICAVLALPVIIHEFSRRAGRGNFWLRTTTALNWSFWLILPLLLVAAIIGALLNTAGLPLLQAEHAALALLGLYLLWLQFFTLRAGLELGIAGAAALTVLNSLAIGLCSVGPVLIGMK